MIDETEARGRALGGQLEALFAGIDERREGAR